MKTILRRIGARLCRPILVRADARIYRIVAESFRVHIMPTITDVLDTSLDSLARLEASVAASSKTAETMAVDIDLLLGSLVREVARLQAQVETLQATLDRVSASRPASLGLIDGDGEDGDWDGSEMRSRVG